MDSTVNCKGCKYYNNGQYASDYGGTHNCRFFDKRMYHNNPIYGRVFERRIISWTDDDFPNKNNDCEYYKRKGWKFWI